MPKWPLLTWSARTRTHTHTRTRTHTHTHMHAQGNLGFSEDENEDLEIEDTAQLSTIASLLGTRPEELERALCYRVVGNKLGSVEKMHTRDQAEYGRDAFAKVRSGIFLARRVYAFSPLLLSPSFLPSLSFPLSPSGRI